MYKHIIRRIIIHSQRYDFYHPWFRFPEDIVHGIARLAPEHLEPAPSAYRLVKDLDETVEYIAAQEDSKALVDRCLPLLREYYAERVGRISRDDDRDVNEDVAKLFKAIPFYAEFGGSSVLSVDGTRAVTFEWIDYLDEIVAYLCERGKPRREVYWGWGTHEVLTWLGYNVNGGKENE